MGDGLKRARQATRLTWQCRHVSNLKRCDGPTCRSADWLWYCPECNRMCERCRVQQGGKPRAD